MLIALASCISPMRANADAMRLSEVLPYRIVNQFPHDEKHYTQGLEWRDGRFIESAGGYGVSALLDKKRANGATTRSISLPRNVFAEGLTQFRDRIFLLTWRERIAYVFSRDFRLLRTFEYHGEGWGLTHDGARLIMSDGSSRLSFRDPETFALTHRVDVIDHERAVAHLNELEYARGWVLANVWQTDRIAFIAPDTGRVHAWLDLAPLHSHLRKRAGWDDRDDVLNGIAYDDATGHLYVTGKRWPTLFELQIEWPQVADR